MQNHNFYAVITAKVLLSKELSDKQKLLVALIANLSNERGYCFATNAYLAECLNCSESTIKENLKSLEEKKVLGRAMNLKPDGSLDFRSITVNNEWVGGSEFRTPPAEISHPPSRKTGYIKTNIKNKEEKEIYLKESNLFRQPNIPAYEQVHEAFVRMGGDADMAKAFYNKYEAVGWYLNNSPIKNFVMLIPSFITNWNKNNTTKQQQQPQKITVLKID